MFFGGKLKKDALDTYMTGLRDEHADEADPFLFYRTTEGNHTNMPSKLSVVNMVSENLQKLMRVSSASRYDGQLGVF